MACDNTSSYRIGACGACDIPPGPRYLKIVVESNHNGFYPECGSDITPFAPGPTYGTPVTCSTTLTNHAIRYEKVFSKITLDNDEYKLTGQVCYCDAGVVGCGGAFYTISQSANFTTDYAAFGAGDTRGSITNTDTYIAFTDSWADCTGHPVCSALFETWFENPYTASSDAAYQLCMNYPFTLMPTGSHPTLNRDELYLFIACDGTITSQSYVDTAQYFPTSTPSILSTHVGSMALSSYDGYETIDSYHHNALRTVCVKTCVTLTGSYCHTYAVQDNEGGPLVDATGCIEKFSVVTASRVNIVPRVQLTEWGISQSYDIHYVRISGSNWNTVTCCL